MNDDLLFRHHEDLARRVESLLTRADGGDSHDLAREWDQFERELLSHFALEERELFPRFARDQPAEATALVQEHESLRRDLMALGVRSDLHFLRAEAVRSFVAALRAHAECEERLFYPWSRGHVDHRTWSTIADRLRVADAAAPASSPTSGRA